MVNTLLEIMYIICGIILIVCGIYALVDNANPKKIGTAAFWIIFGVIFIVGPYINPAIIGALLLVMGALTATKSVRLGSLQNSSEEYRIAQEEKVGNKIFIPALSIGVVAFSVAQFTKLGGLVGLGVGALVSLLLTMLVTKESVKNIPYDS